MSEADLGSIYRSMEILHNNGYEFFFFHNGLGETCMFLRLIHEYKKNGKKIFAFTVDSARTELLEQCPHIDEVMQLDKGTFSLLMSNKEIVERFHPKNFLFLHSLPETQKVKGFKAEICTFLRIPLDTPLDALEFRSDYSKEIEELFIQNELEKGKAVLLVPHAICFGNEVVPKEFWIELVSRLREKGYTPVFNSSEEIVPGVPKVYLSIRKSIEFANQCGNVVGVRTGFMDVIGAFSTARGCVIYPNDENSIWEENLGLKEAVQGMAKKSESYLENLSVSKMFENDNILEFIYSGSCKDIERVMTNLR